MPALHFKTIQPLRRAVCAVSLVLLSLTIALSAAAATQQFVGEKKLNAILTKASANNWRALPIGELMGKVALEFEATPYVANTLELSADKEVCSVNLDGLDCVTFFETTLDMARAIKKGRAAPDALLAEIQATRYRGGAIGDYTSRLHYTSDWLADNEKKRTVEVLSKLPGAEVFPQKVNFMSTHAGSYKQLAAHPELIEIMKRQEEEINARTLMYVPLSKLADVEPFLQTGDIVGICTNIPGLDITHTGLVIRDKDGIPHFMDASSKKENMKVTLEPGSISQYMTASNQRSGKIIGVIFARALEPAN